MRKQVMKIVLIAAVCVTAANGCKGKESVSIATESTKAETKERIMEQTTELAELETENEGYDADWVKLWPGEVMEINLNAKAELIGGFVADGNSIYKAARYNGEVGPYCYYVRRYYRKEEELNKELEFPADIEEVSNDIWEHGMSFWKSALESSNSASLNRSTLSVNVESKEVVKLNGIKFLREEVYAESPGITYTSTTRFVAYYYQTDGGQGVCAFGDRSEEQDQFENVKDVAEAIMATYRMSE